MNHTKSLFQSATLAATLATTATHCACARTLDWDDGVNLQAGYFNPEDKGNIPLGWELMRKFDRIKTVRIEIAPDEDVRIETMQRWIREANENGYKVIATYHRYRDNGSPDEAVVRRAAQWWKTHYATLAEAGPFTINVINEWGSHSQTPESFANAYNEAIEVIRGFYDGPIIVDIPGWGQETYTAAKASPLIKDRNIVFSVHVYSSAYVQQGANHWMQPSDLVNFAKAVDRPIMMGEYGGMREGGADWQALVQQAKDLGWTVLAWAWNGDGEGMNMVLPSWNDAHSPDAYYPSTYFAPAYAYIGETPKPEMILSVQEVIMLGDWAQGYIFAVHSNASWEISVEGGEGWIESMSPLSGWGTQSIHFRVNANTTKAKRTAMVTLTCGDIVKTFPIHQNWKEPAK
jgi:sugar phosphate isomerase/epimerase